MADEVLSVEARLVDNITKTMKGISASTINSLNAMSKQAGTVATSMKGIGKSLMSLKGLLAGVALKKTFDATVGAAGKFESQMASVATLSEEMSNNIGKFSKEVLALSTTSGQGLDTLTKSLFDAVSAGVPAGNAMEFLTTATRLAIGGATETAVAVDGLTTVINAFSLDASQATDVSDAFFVAMKFGKTTIAELATSIGPLAPTARAAGLGFDEMLGAVSALTKAGFNTKLAVTSMQGALVAINSLTPEAKAQMDSLGLAYKVTGQEGSTFADVIVNLEKASGGTLEGMKKLIPSIEGARGILGLATDNAKNFREVLKLMGGRAGATALAYSKFTDTFEFKSNKVKQSFAVIGIEIGNKLMPIFQTLADFVLKHMDVIKNVIGFSVAFVTDVFNGLKATIMILGNFIVGLAADVVSGWTRIISTIMKGINMLPGSIIPEGWIESLDNFAKKADDVGQQSGEAVKSGINEMVSKGSELHKFFTDSDDAIQKNATSVKDLTDAEKALVGIQTEAAQQRKMLSEQELEDKKSFLESIKAIELANLQQTSEGRIQAIETEKAAMLALAQKFGQDETAIITSFNRQIIEESHSKIKADNDATKQILDNEAKQRQGRVATLKVWQSTTSAVLNAVGSIATALGISAKTVKKIALGEAIVSGALAIAKANASAPFPLNLPAIVQASAIAAGQVATIASQAFATGGLPKGRNALIKVNEQGQEAVLNARATSNLGIGGVNALNSGQSANTSVTNQISYNPSININGSGASSVDALLKVLAQDKSAFADFINKEVVGKGY